MIALLFVFLLILAIWLAVRLGGVRKRDQPSGSTRSSRRTDSGTIIGLPGDGSVAGGAGPDGTDSDSFQGGGGDFGGGGASGSWGDGGSDGGGGGD